MERESGIHSSRLRNRLHEIIFEADTPAGKMFDIGLIFCILGSVLVVMLDSVAAINAQCGRIFYVLEWFFTILFSIEYLLRIYSVKKPYYYMTSFYGIVDVLAITPTYLSLVIPGSQYLLVIRLLRVLRIFRVLKFTQYIGEAGQLTRALRASRRKITLFLFVVLTAVVIMGSCMYIIEGGKNGFTSIPKSIYWAIVTITTVGYGDIAPKTTLGEALAALIMIMGYSIIAVPTGIVSAEMTHLRIKISTQACPVCSAEGHDSDAGYCKFCGGKL
ncbi:MAG TPA: ion transporter [bacterium]|nr:ion transporter [bacterium]HPN44405.1 ion transporter [bacterium]